MSDSEIQPGDWVRFYRDGRLVLAEVKYTKQMNYSADYMIYTDVGATEGKSVLECRRAATEERG